MTHPSGEDDPGHPLDTYRTRHAAFTRQVAEAQGAERRLGTWRLVVSVLGLVLAGLAIAEVLPWWPVWLPVLAFVGLVVRHGRASRARFEGEAATRLYDHGLARLEDRWQGMGDTGATYRPKRHPYADDLDLFGEGSLFQLLSTARTHAGERTLAAWLLAPADPSTLAGRQEAIQELRGDLDLREDLARIAGEAGAALDRERALQWGSSARLLTGRVLPRIVAVVGVIGFALTIGWLFFSTPLSWLLVVLAVQAMLTLPHAAGVSAVLHDAEHPAGDLTVVARLLARMESGTYGAALLNDLQGRLDTDGVSASRAITGLTRTMDFVDARRNQIFLPLSWVLGAGTVLAHRIEDWRARHGEQLAVWVEALGVFEALVSLSAYAYEHPEDPFPDVVDGPASYDGVDLGHPLLPKAACVRNSVALTAAGEGTQALLVSGSNMSGKSTLLRTVGVNAVLALAGAPVRATSLRLSELVVGASIAVHDSLQEGASRFYAEIERLREVVGRAVETGQVLFLLDEVLHGTNSHDRRIGAAAVVRSLLEAKAIGLVTTHDLALADIAEKNDVLENVHFEDQLVDGVMSFDYRMRPGVVQRSNALALMRTIGLDV